MVGSCKELNIGDEITILLICSPSLQLPHIDSDGTDLPGGFMTTISAHRGLLQYSIVHDISESVTVLIGKSSS